MDIRDPPWAQANFPPPQYRIAGELQLIGPDHSDSEILDARKQMWGIASRQ